MFRFRAPFVAAAVVAGLQITAAAEREIPKFDITAACRGSGSVQTPAKCMQDEQAARDQLAKLWPQFEQSDASRCIQITTSPAAAASYVELLTCLQAAKIEDKAKDPLGPIPTIAKEEYHQPSIKTARVARNFPEYPLRIRTESLVALPRLL
jgi:hypothetical protein